MQIRTARPQDLPGIRDLLSQVLEIHHQGRPDIFKTGCRKYTDAELDEILSDPGRPIFVALADDAAPGEILGYAFCQHICHEHDNVLTAIRTLYLDDLCVDAKARGAHVGRALYEHVIAYARACGCYNLTLNVWAENKEACAFYEHLGLVPQKFGLEQIL